MFPEKVFGGVIYMSYLRYFFPTGVFKWDTKDIVICLITHIYIFLIFFP